MPIHIKHLVSKHLVITWNLIQSCTDSELRLYLFLKLHAIKKTKACPSTRLAEAGLEWSRGKLTRTIREAESLGHLVVDRTLKARSIYDLTWYDKVNQEGFSDKKSALVSDIVDTKSALVSDKPTQNLPSFRGTNVQAKPETDNVAKNPFRLTASSGAAVVSSDIPVEVTTAADVPSVKDDDRPVSLSEFVAQCEASPRRDIRIVGWWATKAEPPCTTKAQWGVYLRRNLRPAGQLAPFTDDQIRAGYNKMVDAHDEGWLSKPALETVIKFTL